MKNKIYQVWIYSVDCDECVVVYETDDEKDADFHDRMFGMFGLVTAITVEEFE